MSHTKGPWQAKPPRIGAAITIYGADGEFPVATTCSNTSPATMQAHRDGTVAANARLIAAAPVMYEALRAVLNSDMAMREEDEAFTSETLNLVRHAIAEASMS
jgi:hypothetical protein